MCMRQHHAPAPATRPAISGSSRNAQTSFTIRAPAWSAASATAALRVSVDTVAPPAASRSTTGTTRSSSSAASTGAAPGRVDSPPTSTMAAPSRTSSSPCWTAASTSRYSPPSENESGVTFTTPITAGRVRSIALRLGALRAGRALVAAHVRGAAGEARARQRPWALALRLARGRLGRGLRHDRLVGSEDLVLGLAVEQLDELLALDRLAPHQDVRGLVELRAVALEDVARRLVRLLHDPADLAVDLAGHVVGVVRLGAELAAEERLAVVVAEHARAELLAHAEPHHHLLGGGGDLLEVIRRPGRHLAEDDLLRGAAAERHRHRVRQLRARGQELVLGRQRDRVAERLPARDHGDLVHRVGVLEVVGHDRVPHLVERGDLALLLAHHAGLLLRTRDHAHDALFELLVIDLAAALTGGQQSGLVDQVGEVGAGEAGRLGSEVVEVDRLRQRLAARVDLEDLGAALAVRPVDHDLAVEAARTQQRRVQDVRAVRGRDEDDVVLHLEAVHLDEQLVERLLALVVAAAKAGAAVAPDRVDLVHEDDAGAVLLGLLEQVTHARGAHADEHLDEVGARDREERHAGLARDRAREQRLAGARRPVEQHALRYSRAQRLELLGVLQELLDLVELLDGFVDPRDVAEGDLRRVDRHPLRARLAEGHDLRAAALHLVDDEEPEQQEDDERQDVGEDRDPAGATLALHVDLDRRLGRRHLVDQVLLRVVGVADRELLLLAVRLVQREVDRVVLRVEGRRLHEPLLDVRAELGEVGGLRMVPGADDLLGEERQHDHDQDRE